MWTQKQLVLVSKKFPGAKGCDYSQTAASTGLVDASLEIAEVDFLPNEDINQMIMESEMVGNYQGINSK